jgi:VWFA-related protein
MPGYLGKAYIFEVEGAFTEAVISFSFDSSGRDPGFDPVIYHYNEDTQELEELATTVTDGKASAAVSHFSVFVLLDRHIFKTAWEETIAKPGTFDALDVALVIDESGSMSYDASPKNDKDGMRFVVAKDAASRLRETDQAAVVKFSTSAVLAQDFTSDIEALNAAIDSAFTPGKTAIYDAVKRANDAFMDLDRTNARRVMIVLTDGIDNASVCKLEDVAKEAVENDVIIYTVGLGSELDETSLKELAARTDGRYFHASLASELTIIYNEISQEAADMTTDSDGDGIFDYYEERVRAGNGVLLGIDKNNPDSDGDGILDGEEVAIQVAPGSMKVYAYLESNPGSADSDGDGYPDSEDPHPLKWDISDRDLAICADLSYSDLVAGSSVAIGLGQELDGWTVIGYTSTWLSLYAVEFAKDDNIIMAYRGSAEILDWLNDGTTWLFGLSTQAGDAKNAIKRSMDKHPSSNFYITGHSLGGHLAYNAAAKAFDTKKSIVKRVAAFNGLGLVVGLTLLSDAWDRAQLVSNSGKIINYRVTGDVVYSIPITYHYGSVYEVPNTSSGGLFSAHGLINFFNALSPTGR